MAKEYTYPHWETNVIDRSIYQRLQRETLPLFRPIFFMRAQEGPVGVPTWNYSYSEAVAQYGEATFSASSEFFSREALFCNHLLTRQGCFIVRIANDDAKKASVVLELKVKKTDIKQYKRDSYGQFVYNEETGEKEPLLDGTGAQITEPGVELKWQTRTLKMVGDKQETISSLKPATYGTGENEYTVYPILAVEAENVGSYGNDIGIKLFADVDNLDATMANNVGAFPYEFGAVRKAYRQDTVSPLYSFWNNQYESFVAKPNSNDERVDRNVFFDDIYDDSYGTNLPLSLHLYHESFKAVGEIIQDIEVEDDTLVDPYLVNIVSGYNVDGVPMPHVAFSEDDDSIVLNDIRILYMEGGEDGAMDDATVEALTRQYLDNLIYSDILDQARFPFTYIVDTGVSIETKRSFIRFLGKHDAFKLMLSTQDANLGRLNTKAEDSSTGSSLYASCLLQPESVIKNTDCFRAEIYQHAGYLADSTYRGIVPFTIDAMLKKSQYQSTQSILGNAAGLPNSVVSMFRSWNWTATTADHKQRSWDSGLNYVQFYDMDGIHWPAIRTVYRYDTSVLSNAMFSDMVVYCKHIVRYNWARWAGVETEFETLAERAADTLSFDLGAMINDFFNYSVYFYQTEEDAKVGYKSHATIQLWGNPQNRVWEVDIECYRNGYDTSTVEEGSL